MGAHGFLVEFRLGGAALGFGGVEEEVEEVALIGIFDAGFVEPGDALGEEEVAVGVAAHAREREEDRGEIGRRLGHGVAAGCLEVVEDLFERPVAAFAAVLLLRSRDGFINPFPFERRQLPEESGAPADDAAEFFARPSR